jgi:hypothetical protein
MLWTAGNKNEKTIASSVTKNQRIYFWVLPAREYKFLQVGIFSEGFCRKAFLT